ncbi:MAG: P-loop NTPase [Desulfurococcaceae archaeon]
MLKIGVVSGKGGVGKSTISVSLAVALARRGFKVGLVDSDITGPNIHDILGRLELEVSPNDKFMPSESMGVKYVSVGQISSEGLPILWDPKDVASAARQLMERTEWGDLDFLVVDFPPGFESETLEMLPLMDCVVIVTVPSALSKSKVERMVEACREYGVRIAGVVMNMAYFKCPVCGTKHRIFSDDHSFEDLGIQTIAELPIIPELSEKKVINEFPVDSFLKAFENPVLLKRRPKSIRRRLLELLLRK